MAQEALAEYEKRQRDDALAALKAAAPEEAADVEIGEMAKDFAISRGSMRFDPSTGRTTVIQPDQRRERPPVEQWAQENYPGFEPQKIGQEFDARAAAFQNALTIVNSPPSIAANVARQYAPHEEDRARLGQAIVDVMTDERFAGTIAPQQRTFWQNFGENMLRGTEDIARQLDTAGQMITGERPSAPLERIARQAAETADPARSKDAGLLERGVMAGARSIPFTAGGVAAAVATGVPGAVAFSWSQMVPQAFDDFRSRGINEKDAKIAALISGSIEAAIEQWVPFERLAGLKGVGGVGWKDTLAKIAIDRGIVVSKEVGEELF
ncbi:MAG: hypothetical protein AB7I42_24325, partial [Bradyrhizobium sp.]